MNLRDQVESMPSIDEFERPGREYAVVGPGGWLGVDFVGGGHM